MIYILFDDNPKANSRNLLERILGDEVNKIQTNEFGKPYIPNSDTHFNISHSHGAIALIVSDSPCGIDIEKIRPYNPKVVERFFTVEEKTYIADSSINFFEIWTKKEAILKALGIGLLGLEKIPPNDFNTFTYQIEDYMISYATKSPNIDRITIL